MEGSIFTEMTKIGEGTGLIEEKEEIKDLAWICLNLRFL